MRSGPSKDSEPVIGIDLGTTNSCIACCENDGDELGRGDMVVVNKCGQRTTPSCVAFTNDPPVVGSVAKRQMTKNPEKVVFSVKRLMGRRYDDQEVQKDISDWPFKVGADEQGRPQIQVEYKNKPDTFSPEAISAMVLETLKKAAEDRVGPAVKKAVIAVPAYFDNSQKQATLDAGRIAGLEVLGLINEPTAAALAYVMREKESDQEKKMLVFDLGGGTFDVSILSIRGREFNVKAVGGDTRLGGDDFDKCLMDYCRDDLKKRHGLTLSDPCTLNRLRDACREAKENLSAEVEASIDLGWLAEGGSYFTKIARSLFESLCESLIVKCLEHVKETLKQAAMLQSEVDVVLLVGGSTRVPLLQNKLRDLFGGRDILQIRNPDEDVARGAAIKAALLAGVNVPEMESVRINDVTPLSLGVATFGDVFSKIISRNSSIPMKCSEWYKTAADNQTSITLVIYEGERTKASSNHKLGVVTIDGLDPAPQGAISVLTTFSIDTNGILDITVADKQKSKEKKHSIKMNKGRLTQQELQVALQESKRMKKHDEMWRLEALSRNELYRLIQEKKRSGGARILAKCEEFETWLEANQSASDDKYEQMKSDLAEMEPRFRFLR
eukprot:Gregarina_sp_Pseudo_9__5940@NODE_957_length_2031_cov_24_021084_g897_i0_p1_GENE_NODE_957_length_2031_cov_24_021084_g897_i0NODE_957_length_2031_cov_24_021084_g897_i0_p1_ORF_typecomplete_len611_score91_62HSP70/PF00012_20/1_2e101MreB_Mbl/PF06723_13/4_4e23StbA/PF06406_11/2_8e05StbA/PF06406_11/3e03FGGY_C/PF02782_16/1_4e05PilM_2/PF11104_8/4_3e03PilM_2/PF11104_8/0_00078BcrAD_BadFG/PF01869_20/0_98BcrAD_BadFG/PF01869_20/4_3Hydantoinase_A/PF01968_18/4_1e03Hydantoinase_A/PF01968_18/0_025Hydantoinase_A/PF019